MVFHMEQNEAQRTTETVTVATVAQCADLLHINPASLLLAMVRGDLS